MTSGWLGKTQQDNDATGRKAAADRGNQTYTITATDAQEFKRKAALVETEWVADMDKRGLRGKQLRDTARILIDKYAAPVASPSTNSVGKKSKT
jgi:nitrogen fixation protein FixH